MLFPRLTHICARSGAVVICLTAISLSPVFLVAQSDYSQVSDQIAQHLQYGEFSKAIELVDSLPADVADKQLARVAASQAKSGAFDSATQSLSRIGNDLIRFEALSQPLYRTDAFSSVPTPRGSIQRPDSNQMPNDPGARGGVTENDFQPLIRLIRSTVDPDSWDDTNGDGTIQAYPAGVYVDSSGTLKKLKVDDKHSLKRLAFRSAKDSGNRSTAKKSKLRKVSLNRLEKQAQLLAAQGKSLSDDMMHLAGICEIKYLMLLPETNDIVIAGPAGEWTVDNDGHAINLDSGKPILQLDDLVICLRNAQRGPLGNNGKFGCSITPRKQNLAATRQFISTTQLRGKAWRSELRETLGLQDIEVFGIDPATHAGRVLVEADYRMKLVAMGLEPTIPEIPSYLSRLNVGPNGEVEPLDVVRWWFTMNYDEVTTDKDHQVFTLAGTGVKVLSENEFIDMQGERIHTGQSDGPTAGFARDFTRNFDKIADEYPVYRRLKNLFDLSIVSVLIRSQGLDRHADWSLTYFGNDPQFSELVYEPATAAIPHQVDSVMNHRVISQRKKSSTLKHTLVGVSGGITFDAVQVLRSKAKVAEDATSLDAAQNSASELASVSDTRWWWD